MPKGYKVVNVTEATYASLSNLAEDVARREGLSKVSLAGMIERMIKQYKETQA